MKNNKVGSVKKERKISPLRSQSILNDKKGIQMLSNYITNEMKEDKKRQHIDDCNYSNNSENFESILRQSNSENKKCQYEEKYHFKNSTGETESSDLDKSYNDTYFEVSNESPEKYYSESFDFSSQSESDYSDDYDDVRSDYEDQTEDYMLLNFDEILKSVPISSHYSGDYFDLVDCGNFFCLKKDDNYSECEQAKTDIVYLKSHCFLSQIGQDFAWFENGYFNIYRRGKIFVLYLSQYENINHNSLSEYKIKPLLTPHNTDNSLFRYSLTKMELEKKELDKKLSALITRHINIFISKLSGIEYNMCQYIDNQLNDKSVDDKGIDMRLPSLIFSEYPTILNLESTSSEISQK